MTIIEKVMKEEIDKVAEEINYLSKDEIIDEFCPSDFSHKDCDDCLLGLSCVDCWNREAEELSE